MYDVVMIVIRSIFFLSTCCSFRINSNFSTFCCNVDSHYYHV
jgi:hypothetical protein